MKVAVLIPSYRRPADLERCLFALSQQVRAPDQVVVVVRVEDEDTKTVAAAWLTRLPLDVVEVSVPGVVYAMNAGLAQCEGDILAITDDDAAPRSDWLERIAAYFCTDGKIGGIGGRDWVHQNGVLEDGMRTHVGNLFWYGRIIGNHHLGSGMARDVNVLKGVNCAFRLPVVRLFGFDSRLRGQGAQVHWEMSLCFAISGAGWRLIYDPAIAVDHYPAPRFDVDQRETFDPKATYDRAFNRRLACALIRPAWRRAAVILWDLAIGTRDEPGVLGLLRGIFRGDKFAVARYRATMSAYWMRHAG